MNFISNCSQLHILNLVCSFIPKWPTVKWWWKRHDCIGHRQETQEKNEEEKSHVEIVWFRCFEDPFMRNITAHNSPTLKVHWGVQPKDINSDQSWSIKWAHPIKEATKTFTVPYYCINITYTATHFSQNLRVPKIAIKRIIFSSFWINCQ